MSKYIVTVESGRGVEIVCRPRDGPFVDKSKAKDFVQRHIKDFPWCTYRVYKLDLVELCHPD